MVGDADQRVLKDVELEEPEEMGMVDCRDRGVEEEGEGLLLFVLSPLIREERLESMEL